MGKIVLWNKDQHGLPLVYVNEDMFVKFMGTCEFGKNEAFVCDVDAEGSPWTEWTTWFTRYQDNQRTNQAEHDRKRIAQLELKTVDLANQVRELSGRLVGGAFAVSGTIYPAN